MRIVALLCLSALCVACTKADSAGVDASSPAIAASDAAAHAPVAALGEATNEADIAHHPGDKAIDHVVVVVKSATAAAATDAGSGKAVAALRAGDKATIVAQYGGYRRILFADPKDATKKLTGWVQKYVFATGFEGHPIPICPANQIVVSDAASPLEPRCSTRCKTSADCHGAAKYCYQALVLAIENEDDPPASTPIDSCGSDARLAAAPTSVIPTPSAAHRADAGAR